MKDGQRRILLANVKVPNDELLNVELPNVEWSNIELPNDQLPNVESYRMLKIRGKNTYRNKSANLDSTGSGTVKSYFSSAMHRFF
jgi:hypothetical protein